MKNEQTPSFDYWETLENPGILAATLEKFPGLDAEKDTGSHHSDFYVVFTPDVWQWLKEIHPYPQNLERFTGTDGRPWICVPFAIDPRKTYK